MHNLKNMRLILYSVIILVLNGCSNSEKDNKRINSVTSDELPSSELDSFYVGKILFKVESLNEKDFNLTNQTTVLFDTLEVANIQRDSNSVKRINDTLKLLTDIGEILVVNNPSDNDDFCKYEYLYFESRLNKYVIAGSYWESSDYLLIDKLTGTKSKYIGLPSVSPNRKYILTGNCDLVAGFTYNGIELYKKSTSIELIGSRELNSWGPLNLKWINDSTIFAKVSIADTSRTTLERTGYLRLTINE